MEGNPLRNNFNIIYIRLNVVFHLHLVILTLLFQAEEQMMSAERSERDYSVDLD